MLLQFFLGIVVATLVMTYALCKASGRESRLEEQELIRDERTEIKIGCIKQSLGEVEERERD